MKGIVIKTGLVFGLVIVLLSSNITPGLLERSSDSDQQKSADELFIPTNEKNAVFSLNVFGTTNLKKQDIVLSADNATLIFKKLKELKFEMTQHPYSEKTQSLKIAFVDMLDEKGLIPNGVSKEAYLSLLNPKWVERLQKTGNTASSLPQPFANRGTCALCSLGGEGTGLLLPLFLLPRPRIAMLWLGTGLNTAANLLTGKGYIAGGAQVGFAFGFMGIGISYALPGYTLYGFIGYALLASTTAEYVEHYPPNRAPVISDVNPTDGEQNVPLSLSELQFRITDSDGDLMSYTVTTDPDIGSASGNLKPFGVYSVPVSGLVDLTKYTWYIQVTDGKDTTEETMTFTTEAIAPIISNPIPSDGERDVPMDIPVLQFTLKDYQGDTMEYTVQTSPNIGSDHKVGVHDGTYTIPVSGLTYGATYRWYVNVTDGAHWTRKILSFETGYPSQFDPFEFGWQYRKQITINHTQVADDLTNFPVLVSTDDNDLSQKAQVDGDDILFMNNAGISTRVYYDLESYDASSGTLVAWVNIPFLSSNDDTVFYMYYGNPSCINQEYPQKTWDSHYLAVWHMDDTSTGIINDMTSNNEDGTVIGTISTVTGKIGHGANFDGNSNILISPTTTDNKFTINAWAKSAGHPTNWKGIFDSQTGRALLALYQSKVQHYDITWRDSGITFSTTDWNHIVLIKDGTEITFFVNGVKTTATGITCNIGGNTRLGSSYDFDTTARLTGTMDQVEVSNTARSDAWILTSFHTMNDPTNFISIGPEEPGP